MKNTIIVVFNIVKRGVKVDIEIPTDITTKELFVGLNQAYNLGMDTTDIKQCYLKAENPITLLRGNKLINETGLRNGSIIYFTE